MYIKNIAKKNKWIVEKQDLSLLFDRKKFQQFISNNYSFDLGWDKKPGYSNFDFNNKRKIFYSIEKKGFRTSKFKNLKNTIATFGDSYTFCRQVKNSDTWQEITSNKIKNFISNYGVGNYGLDQAFLKYKKTRIRKETKIIIFGFVPETICRIQSCWKYYLEFGNLHGFKPFCSLKKKKLTFEKNLLTKKIKFYNLKKIISKTEKLDRFYRLKYLKYVFQFSYVYSFFKNFSYNIYFFIDHAKYLLKKNNYKNNFEENIFSLVMNKNIKMSHLLYTEDYSKNLLKELFKKIENNIKKNIKCYFIIFPQLFDLNLKSRKYYQYFYEQLKINYNIIDLTQSFLEEKNYKRFYTNDKYGGHLNYKGNLFAAKIISDKLNNEVRK